MTQPAAERTESRRSRRWLGGIGAVALVTVILALVAVHQYGTIAVWSPTKIPYCHRNYLRNGGQAVSAADIAPSRTVGRAPALLGRPILTTTTPAATPGTCPVEIYLQTRTDHYTTYTLSGGP